MLPSEKLKLLKNAFVVVLIEKSNGLFCQKEVPRFFVTK